MKQIIRKIAEWILSKTTENVFDSEIVAMTTCGSDIYIATKRGTIYKGYPNTWEVVGYTK